MDDESISSNFNTKLCGIKKDVKDFGKFREKKRKIVEHIKFINKCIRHHITPNFVRKIVKYNKNSKAQIAAERKVMEIEKNKHYRLLSELDLKVYSLHLKIAKEIGHFTFQNLENRFFDCLNFRMKQKRRNLNKKFENLKWKKEDRNGRVFEETKQKVNSRPENVINLSKKSFTDAEMQVLDKGLNTCVDYVHKVDDYVADIEISIFGKTDEEKSLTRSKCEKVIKQVQEKEANRKKFRDKKTLELLNKKEVIYTKADKGNKIVIMEKEDYQNNMNNLLAGEEYTEVTSDPLKLCLKSYNNTMKKIKKVLNDKEKSKLKSNNPVIPRLYGLPKVHKPGNKMRPIISNVNAPTYNLATWLTRQFSNLPQFESKSIKNSLELAENIKNLQLKGSDRLVSFDVVSLFPSIPREKLLVILKNWLSTTDLDEELIEEYIILTKLCIDQNYFVFRNKFYELREGLAMGNPLSPFLANLYMSSLETHITGAFPYMFKMWYRYVDDVIAVVDEKLFDDAVKLLNLQDKAIKFTAEKENENVLPFLDLKIIRNQNSIEFGIFRKDTQSDNFINNYSFNPRQQKHAAINHLTYRLVNLPLNKSEYYDEYKHIISIVQKNGFSKDLVDKKIKKFRKQKLINETSTLSRISKDGPFRKFTYHPWAFHKFQKIFKDINVNLVPVNKQKIKNILNFDTKDKILTSKKSGIYQINCKDCDKLYIGKTKRSLEVRQKEHFRNIKYKHIENSAVAHHYWVNQHNFENEVKLLKNVQHPIELTIWEKLFIQKNKKYLLNFDIPNDNDLISRYIGQGGHLQDHGGVASRTMADDEDNGP